MTDIISIPLNKLSVWNGNVRKTQNKAFIEELAASIRAHGLQQNLVVTKVGKGFGVVAGGQRLKALTLLAEEGFLKATHPVPCKIVEDGTEATELSLAENVIRDDMHPADQFEAFRLLVDKGEPVEDIAARFGVTASVVTQRLKLARVSPRILKAYREEELSLEDVMAFAVTDDHAAQERVFANMRNWGARQIRDALTENDVAASDRRVQFVTLKAYEKAGGATRRDLFTEGEDGIFIADTVLLDKLVLEKLSKAAKPLSKEGWKWVEVRPAFSYEERTQLHRVHPELKPLSPEDEARLEALEKEHSALVELWESGDADDPRPGRLDEIEEAMDKLQDRDEVWPPETLAIAGAVVTIGYDAKVSIERGLVRPEDKPKRTSKAKASPEAGDTGSDGHDAPPFSAQLVEYLTAEKSIALTAELLHHPKVGLAAVVHAFAPRSVFGNCSDVSSLEISAPPQSLQRVQGSKAFATLEAARQAWIARLPRNPDALWNWCLEQDQSVLLELLAFCAARTVNTIQTKNGRDDEARLAHATQLASALSLDMNAWFTPTAANYFGRISKAQILEALREARNAPPAPAWEKAKKAELATLAEREVSGTGWLPPLLR